jgi:hypothetical protein
MLPALLVIAAVFAALFLVRVGGAQRRLLLARWPAFVFAGAATLALARGALWPAAAFGALAGLAWVVWPRLNRPRPNAAGAPPDPADAEARALLGVSAAASEAEIRRAYRAKMARAHPDRGGTHAEAARLTAARDRLLRRRR